ncbi:hypothetical protein [Cypionkella sp.]|jgi:hypothetical protein|uniref:hypothetical protein n=1 Tax=Cypionkella sp. TaxID=2811411 RepID=UPI002746FD9C|nr:hypothetical protein [Cypionkella sp.]
MSVLEDMGDALARDVISAMEELGDDRFFDKVSKVLLDASPTMQEAFLTAYRVRVAEKRGRAYIEAALKAKREGREGPRVVMDQGGGH